METDNVDVQFDALPVLEGSKMRHSWDVFGRDDQLGTINRLTPQAVISATQSVKTGQRVGLSLSLELPDPPLFGRKPFSHSIFATGRNTWDDYLDGLYPQASSQWDSLRHIRAREDGFYSGWQGDPDTDAERLGIQNWAEVGIVGRGLFIDLCAHAQNTDEEYDPFTPVRFEPKDIEESLAAQQTSIKFGDILCIRFGWVDKYLSLEAKGRSDLSQRYEEVSTRAWAGLTGDESMSRYLWNSGAAAIVCDNPAVEFAPGDPLLGSLHRRLIPGLGFALGELFDFSRLAEACAANRRSDFLFLSVPLKLTGGVGSPGSAVAVF